MVFHSVFYQGADRETCARIIHANSGDYRRIRLLSLTETGISDESCGDTGNLWRPF